MCNRIRWSWWLAAALLLGSACGDDDDNDGGAAGTAAGGRGGTGGARAGAGAGGTAQGGGGAGGRTGGSGGAGGTAGRAAGSGGAGGGGAGTLCAKYGGAEAVDGVVREHIVPALAGDCRISPFFTTLTPAALLHVEDCLAIQVQGLFGCPGVTYEGSEDSAGAECRDMRASHANLGVSSGDFAALIDDVVKGLTEAGVAGADIQAAAPALLGLKDEVTEAPDNEGYTRSTDDCDADAGVP
ncbi:MAG: hypothetical protein ABW321_01690 [Polyangiales bacterium]